MTIPMQYLLLLLSALAQSHLSLILAAVAPPSYQFSKPGCPDRCGNRSIPYPFGLQEGCYLQGFNLRCDESSSRLFLGTTTIEATGVSLDSTVTAVYPNITRQCFGEPSYMSRATFSLLGLPYFLSATRNRFTAIGCDTTAIFGAATYGREVETGCTALCTEKYASSSMENGTCTGVGCCQLAVPKSTQFVVTSAVGQRNGTWMINNCSYAFVADERWYRFNSLDLKAFNRSATSVVLDWAVGTATCEEARMKPSEDFLCGDNTECYNSTNGGGYRCRCIDGFQGNPYLPLGCQDIDECSDPKANNCSDICENTLGGYICSCPKDTYGDGRKGAKGCIEKSKFPLVAQIITGVGLSSLFAIALAFYTYLAIKKRNMIRLKEKYFDLNGGRLLRQQLAARGEGPISVDNNAARIFTESELKQATDNFDDSRILGRGGNGTVYRGTLPDGSIVAIKKSITMNRTQMDQFVNEVVILSQVIHKNVVKLVGCCLETEVPLLIYEFVPNKTLSEHIHGADTNNKLPWEVRLRVAAETAGAIAYLHTCVAQQVIHRDIKSANILLDNSFTAKVADFGASRLVPMDQIEVATMVQGTLGYMDPEYFYTGQLTDKSDVFSFGVVLAELITGEKSLSNSRGEDDSSLTAYFTRAMREGRLVEILDAPLRSTIEEEGGGVLVQLQAVAEIARRCVRQRREDRPSMTAVAAELERVRGPVNLQRPLNDDDDKEDHSRGFWGGGRFPMPAAADFDDSFFTRDTSTTDDDLNRSMQFPR